MFCCDDLSLRLRPVHLFPTATGLPKPSAAKCASIAGHTGLGRNTNRFRARTRTSQSQMHTSSISRNVLGRDTVRRASELNLIGGSLDVVRPYPVDIGKAGAANLVLGGE